MPLLQVGRLKYRTHDDNVWDEFSIGPVATSTVKVTITDPYHFRPHNEYGFLELQFWTANMTVEQWTKYQLHQGKGQAGDVHEDQSKTARKNLQWEIEEKKKQPKERKRLREVNKQKRRKWVQTKQNKASTYLQSFISCTIWHLIVNV